MVVCLLSKTPKKITNNFFPSKSFKLWQKKNDDDNNNDLENKSGSEQEREREREKIKMKNLSFVD